jgi:hypothetical protein
MILISHRGNLNGANLEMENRQDYIDIALGLKYDVEIDIWMINDALFLGHDEPQYRINEKWLSERADKLWIHAKNISIVEWLVNKNNLHWFWHQEDTITLTSKKFIWAFPGKQIITNSIAVMPELYNDDITKCIGICTNLINTYDKITRIF